MLQKVQPLVAVVAARLILGEEPRRRFGWFLVPALAGVWLIAFPSPFDVHVSGLVPVAEALAAACLWALGTVFGRYLGRRLVFQHVLTVRFAFGFVASAIALPILGASVWPGRHDAMWIVALALVTGAGALTLYYYGLRRTPASLATLAELAYPVTAGIVGFLAFGATLRWSQWLGVAVTVCRRRPAAAAAAGDRPRAPRRAGSRARVKPSLTVVGSINLDLVAYCERLPRPGETVTDARFERHPGGKGANQAVAAARLGASVRIVGCVGDDDYADEALGGLQEAGVELELQRSTEPTGVALITVDAAGENEIVVAPGANARLRPRPVAGPVLCQLEIPDEVVEEARRGASFLCLNAAPARPVDVVPDLLVVNRYEYEVMGDSAPLVAVTLGEEGAVLLEHGKEVCRAEPPRVEAVDGTAAGDAFTACLVVSLLEGRPREEALARACAAGAIAASRVGAQPSLPTAAEIDGILVR